eukprot:5913037-Amphidinium_carterae.1
MGEDWKSENLFFLAMCTMEYMRLRSFRKATSCFVLPFAEHGSSRARYAKHGVSFRTRDMKNKWGGLEE